MLALLASIVIFVALLKINSSMTSNKEHFINNGVSEKEFTTLRIYIWGYLFALLLINIPIKPVVFIIYPVPIILLVLLPGILKSRKLSAALEISGTDRGASAGDVANRAMWLGISIGIVIVFSWGWSVFVGNLINIL